MEINDEILNRFLDNELSREEINELNNVLKNDPAEMQKLRAHKMLDEILRKLEHLPSPAGIELKIMERIYRARKITPRTDNFFRFVIGLFVLFTLVISAYIIQLPAGDAAENFQVPYLEKATHFIKNLITSGGISFSGNTLLTVGSVLALILLGSGFFFVDSYRKLKKLIKQI